MKNIALILFILVRIFPLSGQTIEKHLSLEEALKIAREQSLDALVAKNQMRIAYWQYRNYRADLLPSMTLSGTLPSLDRSISNYLKEDGTYKFVSSSSISEQLSLSIDQNIPFTGGKISIESIAQRMDELEGNKRTDYMSIPVSISLNQPLITSNPLKWAIRIEPERYKQAQQQYAVNQEAIAIRTLNYYFDLLLAKENSHIAKQNLQNADKLYEVAQGKKKIGLISDNDLLQLKLNKLNASTSVIRAEQDYEQTMFSFRNYLGYNDRVVVIPEIPRECPVVDVSLAQALELASVNNPFSRDVLCRQLEARQQIAAAKANRGFRADLFASIGYTGNGSKFKHAYQDLRSREMVSLGISIPILDWGKGRGKVELARSQQEIVENQLKQESMNFEQNVMTVVRQYQEQTRLTDIARLADTVSQQRYKTAFETFLMGKISVLDINSAQTERDNAKRNYISQLYSSWLYFYTLRQITLFDFERKENIITEYMQP